MKDLLNSRLGRIAVKVLIWGLVSFVVSAAGSGLMILVMNIARPDNLMNVITFCYGIFYFIGFVSFYLLAVSMITLLVMSIAKYSKRYF
jgi:hypothetical protein